MQLLVKRINREPLEQALEEQSVWSLLENGGTFLEGVSLMARWGGLTGLQGFCRGLSLCMAELDVSFLGSLPH